MKKFNSVMGFLFVLSLVAFASCEKNETVTKKASALDQPSVSATVDYEKPYTDVLVVPKNYYSVGVLGRVYTSQGLLYSKIHTQVTLTKLSERNVATFSMEESESEYRVTVVRIKSPVVDTKVPKDICTDDPDKLSKWVLEATLEGHTVKVCFDKDSGMWYGYIVEE